MHVLGRRLALVASAAIVLAGIVAAPVSAGAPLEQEHYSGSDAGTWSDCGPTYTFSGSWRGVFTLKPGRAGDPTPYLTDNYESDWLYTNPANGHWYTEHGNGIYKDVKITNLYGTVYRYVAEEAGMPFVITASSGRRISFDRGLLRYGFDVDTHGDADLENDEFLDGSDHVIGDHGRHPQFYRDLDAYCAIVNDLLG